MLGGGGHKSGQPCHVSYSLNQDMNVVFVTSKVCILDLVNLEDDIGYINDFISYHETKMLVL